jgi:hypothetical protein
VRHAMEDYLLDNVTVVRIKMTYIFYHIGYSVRIRDSYNVCYTLRYHNAACAKVKVAK